MNTNSPIVTNPIVDKLAFILPWAEHCTFEEQQQKLQPVKIRIQAAINDGLCEKVYLTNSRYIEKFRILLSSKVSVLVQVGAVAPERQKGGIHITMNPSRLSSEQVQQFHKIMAQIVGKIYFELLKMPLLNRADFAIDILNVNFDDLLVNYQHSRCHTVFAKRLQGNGKIEGYNFGSVNSAYVYAVYDKRTERIHRALINLVERSRGRDELHENSVKRFMYERNGPERVRVEVRAVKLGGLRPFELEQVTNRFTRFELADLASDNGSELSEFDRTAFLAMCRHDGVRAALAMYERERPDVPVRQFWKSKRADWWNPESAWSDACNALRQSGIFPDCAFQQPTVHNLALASPEKKSRRLVAHV